MSDTPGINVTNALSRKLTDALLVEPKLSAVELLAELYPAVMVNDARLAALENSPKEFADLLEKVELLEDEIKKIKGEG